MFVNSHANRVFPRLAICQFFPNGCKSTLFIMTLQFTSISSSGSRYVRIESWVVSRNLVCLTEKVKPDQFESMRGRIHYRSFQEIYSRPQARDGLNTHCIFCSFAKVCQRSKRRWNGCRHHSFKPGRDQEIYLWHDRILRFAATSGERQQCYHYITTLTITMFYDLNDSTRVLSMSLVNKPFTPSRA